MSSIRNKSIGGQNASHQKHIMVINNNQSRLEENQKEKKLERDETLEEMKKISEVVDDTHNVI